MFSKKSKPVTVQDFLNDEIQAVDDYRQETNLPEQGDVVLRVDDDLSSVTPTQFCDTYGDFIELARSRTQSYIIEEATLDQLVVSDGQDPYEVTGYDLDNSGYRKARHRTLKLNF